MTTYLTTFAAGMMVGRLVANKQITVGAVVYPAVCEMC